MSAGSANNSQDPFFSLGAKVEYHPIVAKKKRGFINSVRKSSQASLRREAGKKY